MMWGICFLIILAVVSSFSLTRPMGAPRASNFLKMAAEDELTVRGDEGLLDTSRMEKAFKGTGITVPEDKRLKVGVIGCGLAGMIAAMELAEAGHKVRVSLFFQWT